ncbi:MAG: ATP-dependent DNA helicase RecQ [Acidobacteriaceae bacterium]
MDLLPLLQSTFRFPAFRENQEPVCQALTSGRDVLLVMPTGAGKSLCYQLPAVARAGAGPFSPALVINPLIALMEDQATKLSAHGLRVARIHSGLSRDHARQVCRDYLDGQLQFLFIAPERLRVPGFPEMLARRKPCLIAVDEAHCISGWGHDFRPDYRTLGDTLPLLRPAPVIALTATATPAVQHDIVAQLGLQQPALFIHGFRRDNLAIEVVELTQPQRPAFIAGYLNEPARRPAIVYAPSRKRADQLALELNALFPAASYHAGLDPSIRDQVQRAFLAGKLEVVVATIAFGMGIDKPNIRTVLHAALPASLEGYYQEIGRAGRDGLPSRAILLHGFADRKIHESFFARDYPPVEDLARVARLLTDEFQPGEPLFQKLNMLPEDFERAVNKLASQGAAQFDLEGRVRTSLRPADTGLWRSGYQQQLAHRRAQLDRIVEFAETPQCRMSALVRHFGDTPGRPCGHCDFCSPERATAQPFAEPTPEEERDLRRILRELVSSGPKSTGRLFTEVSRGPNLPAARRTFDALLDGLARAGLIALSSETFTNPEGREITFRKAALTYEGRTLGDLHPLHVLLRQDAVEPGALRKPRKPKSAHPAEPASPGQAAPTLTPAQSGLEERLRSWRKSEAAAAGKPSFFVLHDAVLAAIVLAAPRTVDQLLRVRGIGPAKVDRYGPAIIALCRGEVE